MIALIVACGLFVLLGGIWFVSRPETRPLHLVLSTVAGRLHTDLILYYRYSLHGHHSAEDFLAFIAKERERHGYALEPPPPEYASEIDLAFFVFFPESLDSPEPSVLFYTEPVWVDHLKQPRRFVVFAEAGRTRSDALSDSQLAKHVGAEFLQTNTANLYYWLHRTEYLEDRQTLGEHSQTHELHAD